MEWEGKKGRIQVLYSRREMHFTDVLIGAGSLALMVMLFGAYPTFFSGMGIGRWAFILVWGTIAGVMILIRSMLREMFRKNRERREAE